MTINDHIQNEKLQYDINKEVAKIFSLTSGKIHKYEYLTGEKLTIEDVISKHALNNDEEKKELKNLKK